MFELFVEEKFCYMLHLIGDEDYKIPPDQYIEVTFSAGKTRAPFTVDIINDDQLENSETFRVSIFVLSLPYGINLGSTRSTTVTIQDDDSKKLFIYTIYLLILL